MTMFTTFPWIVIELGVIVLVILKILQRRRASKAYMLEVRPQVICESDTLRAEEDFSGVSADVDFSRSSSIAAESTVNYQVLMQIIISIAVLGSALFIILNGTYSEAEQKWAYGVSGTILGFWFNSGVSE